MSIQRLSQFSPPRSHAVNPPNSIAALRSAARPALLSSSLCSLEGSCHSYLRKFWDFFVHLFRSFLRFFGLIEKSRSLSPKEREYRIREGAANIRARLARAFQNAQDQMAGEIDKPFRYLHPQSRVFHGQELKIGKYDVGLCHAQGRREEMEDEHLAKAFTLVIQGKRYPIQLFGIFDGHGGRTAARFIRDHLYRHLERALIKYNPNGLNEVGIWNALKMTFVRLNQEFKAQYENIEKTSGKWKGFISDEEGSTATVAIILDGKIFTANVGDSRTVLDNYGVPIQLSEDAKPGEPRYERGVQNRGGKVILKDVPRVNGDLAVARSIGDFRLKGAISARPKITVLPLSEIKEGSHLVLTCDGIVDVCSTRQLVEGVHAHRGDKPRVLAEDIVYSAYKAGSDDNLSALVVELKS